MKKSCKGFEELKIKKIHIIYSDKPQPFFDQLIFDACDAVYERKMKELREKRAKMKGA